MSGCVGLCCVGFVLSPTPEKLAAEPERFGPDGAYILDMLIEVESHDENRRFNCRHFDFATFKCTAYESRPKMCRDHPSYDRGSRCDHHCGLRYRKPLTVRSRIAPALWRVNC